MLGYYFMAELLRLSWSRETMAVGQSRDKKPELRDVMKEVVVWFEDLTG